MKAIRNLLSVLVLVVIFSCGGGDGGGDDLDNNFNITEDASNFSGNWTLRDHSCLYDPINTFYVSQSDDSVYITVLDAGSSVVSNGDIFEGEIETSDREGIEGWPGIWVEDLLCAALKAISSDMADYLSERLAIDVRNRDIWALCYDPYSADEKCSISYLPISAEEDDEEPVSTDSPNPDESSEIIEEYFYGTATESSGNCDDALVPAVMRLYYTDVQNVDDGLIYLTESSKVIWRANDGTDLSTCNINTDNSFDCSFDDLICTFLWEFDSVSYYFGDSYYYDLDVICISDEGDTCNQFYEF